MCNKSCINFVRAQMAADEVVGKRVLEVGSLDVNGSVRPVIEALEPQSYLGVDIESGPRVDEICDVSELVERYGESSFDVVVATELVEHVQDWRTAFTNIKRVVRPGGTILITTRSRGFPIHGHPWDYWRYEPEDMQRILADFEIVALERDPDAPGVFVRAWRPMRAVTPAALEGIRLYSVITGRRTRRVSDRAARFSRTARSLSQRAARPLQLLRNRLALRTRFKQLVHKP